MDKSYKESHNREKFLNMICLLWEENLEEIQRTDNIKALKYQTTLVAGLLGIEEIADITDIYFLNVEDLILSFTAHFENGKKKEYEVDLRELLDNL